MGTPAGYLAWCNQRGINAHHPDEWDASDVAAYRAWKRDLYVSKWKAYRDQGMHRLWAPSVLRMKVAEDYASVVEGPPSRVYQHCPCHPFSPVGAKPDTSPHGLAYIKSFARKAVPA